ncbi:hypothetical protein ILUMI_19951 [Ignelater luminosus]|uniref:Peptidase S1 domain-containing protein n=1 Tax=Ignelater luminosus TaxID=2038154 RepID=A0A8K0CF70_IGNLU|nr:hypothetical protein ILUMI_19951 [Ignelater luminosus]
MKNIESIVGIILLLLSGSLEKLPYILGGKKAAIANLPFQVAIVVKQHPYGKWLKGGGTIVTTRLVISSASIIIYISEKMFTNGFVYVHANSAYWKNGTSHEVTDKYTHPRFSETTFDHDIAVVQVKTPFNGEYEKPIKLAAKSYKVKSNKAIISGWGTKTHYPVQLEDRLQKLNVAIIKHNDCKKIYRWV